MGNSGSYTEKATINSNLFVFTKWGHDEIQEFLRRGQEEMPETFALRKHEFEFLLGEEMVDFNTSRALFQEIFDLDANQLVDKFEVMCIVCLTSKIGNQEKIHFFFDLFNFNAKGYLYESELLLMLMAISRGVFKVDQKYLPPNNRVIATLVKEAFIHARENPNYIRKPELVNFALGNKEVLSFLESWRGHASQVLLGADDKWKDLTFPCLAKSVTPNEEWQKLGMPPPSFIRWRRRQKLGSDLGYLDIFTHELSYLKTVDRRVVYSGPGVLGRGYLHQGLLADRWVLNALAAMTARPDTILTFLASTGQEQKGRFCVRFYEGAGWRTVNVDDRIPCSIDGIPLFATSSHSREAWPLIVEKGLAKYLGSYGHIGAAGVRGDASEAALRLLTGAHVRKYAVKHYGWRSVEAEILGENGPAFIRDRLAEGSLISLGRSECMVLMQKPILKPNQEKKDLPIIPPHGRLFPVLACTHIKGFNYLILRDAFDLISDCDLGVNYESGQCRTFKIKVEDVPAMYDTMMVGRFPDSLRDKAEKLRIPPWRTEIVMQDSESIARPATFLLSVSKSGDNGIRLNPIRRLGDRHANIIAVLNESDGKVQSELTKYMTLREKVDFSRVRMSKDAYQTAAAEEEDQAKHSAAANADATRKEQPQEETRGTGGEAAAAAEAADQPKTKEQQEAEEIARLVQQAQAKSSLRKTNDDEEDTSDCVDVALTFSSSCDWTFAGSEAANPRLRVRITPTADTLVQLQERDRRIAEIRRQIKEIMAARQAAAKRLEMELIAEENGLTLEEYQLEQEGQQGQQGGGEGPGVVAGKKEEGAEEGGGGGEEEEAAAGRGVRRASPDGAAVVAGAVQETAQEVQGVEGGEDQKKVSFGDQTAGEGKEDAAAAAAAAAAKDSKDARLKYDVIFTAERSWTSQSIMLYPGDYYVLADVAFQVPYEQAFQITLPEHIGEAPWLDGKHPANPIHQSKGGRGASSSAGGLKSFTRRSSTTIGSPSATAAGTPKHGRSKLVIPSHLSLGTEDLAGEGSGGGGGEGGMKPKSSHTGFSDASSGRVGDGQQKSGRDLSQLPRVWLQVSSVEKFDVRPLRSSELPLGFEMDSLKKIVVPKEQWPFATESQRDTSSRCLLNMLTTVKTSAQVTGLQFMQLANEYRDERKKWLSQDMDTEQKQKQQQRR